MSITEYRLATTDPYANSRDRVVPFLVPAPFEREAEVLFATFGVSLPGCRVCSGPLDEASPVEKCKDLHEVCKCGERYDRPKAKECRRRKHPKMVPEPPPRRPCSICEEEMIVVEEGQTRHPNCEAQPLVIPRVSDRFAVNQDARNSRVIPRPANPWASSVNKWKGNR